ncbi:hypothetical protein F5Y15DRAFT_60612 [Xylariaceae sp. FL0016]|nr:hypothetical protein F5Y15DRAFT_60612 [Xylariaceae sp. FL0016]
MVTGTCHDYSDPEDFVAIRARDGLSQAMAQQNWPVAGGSFKSLIMLQPGPNTVDFGLYHKGQTCGSERLVIQYQPLLQLPPLHLAIMVARDSPLLIDCPPAKRGAISSAHSTLDAAITKLRMAAYMWQAQMAEDFRLRGLGRRSFRLDEEWGIDTTTASSLQRGSDQPRMDTLAKVHVVRSEKTVEELRNPNLGHSTPHRNRDPLSSCFEKALAAGGHFVSATRPVIAGMVLDAHYSVEQGKILAQTRRGICANLSYGLFGSHTTYAWPRFLEEVASCLLDSTPTGDAVANDHGLCSTMKDACSVGQNGMLAEVQRAFGAEKLVPPFTAKSVKGWQQWFITSTDSTAEIPWSLPSVLQIMARDHFKLPGDKRYTPTQLDSSVTVRCILGEDDEASFEATCLAGIAHIRFLSAADVPLKEINFLSQDADHLGNTISPGPTKYLITASTLEQEFDRSATVGIEVLGMHGKLYKLKNMWALLADRPFLKIPGTSVVLSKRSVKSAALEQGDDNTDYWKWALLLKRRHTTGGSRLTFASRIDIRIGATMDGAVVYYDDGSSCNCGRANQRQYGGHQHQDKLLTEASAFEITEVALSVGSAGWGSLAGCRMTLQNGESWGAINGNENQIRRLVCSSDETIIGFYGQSNPHSGYTFEFGIITAPKDVVNSVDGLPRQIYDMPELKNTDGGLDPNAYPASDFQSEVDSDQSDDEMD